MKLFEQFAHRGYHSCVMTTFGIDFAAFESIALHRLRGAGCNNNLVIVDVGMLAHALESAIELPRHAGRQYTVTGTRSKGVFHPKVIVQLGRKTGRVFVSSANLTAPGLAGNLEVIGCISASPDDSGESRLLASAWHYVERFFDLGQEAVACQVERMRKQAAWLMDIPPAEGVVSLANGEAAAFLEGAGNSTIASRFVTLLGGDPVKRLVVVSPYWDEDLKALRDLHESTGAREVSVIVGGYRPSFPTQRLAECDAIRLLALGAEHNRFIHGKVVIAQTRDADHVLYGSANCTVAGIGAARAFAGRNDEACLYRRMKRGAALRELHLESAIAKENVLKGKDLPTWQVRPEVPLEAAIRRDPGRFVIRGAQLLWWPTDTYANDDARVELLGRTGDMVSVELTLQNTTAHGGRCFVINESSEPAYFARVRIGREVSGTAVIVMPDVLRQETREARTRQLEQVAERLNGRERLGPWIMDFIDLIMQAEAFETKPHRTQDARVSRRHGSSKPTGASPGSTLRYDEFIAGRKLREDRKPIFQSAFAGSDLDLVRSYLNRIIGLGTIAVDQDEVDDGARIREALALRDEVSADTAATFELRRQPTDGELSESRRKNLEEQKAREAIAARLAARADIAKFSIKFCNRMQTKVSEKPLVLQDMLRLRAVLMMMLGAACPIGASVLDKRALESQVLRPDGENGWTRLIGRVLSTFFAGVEPMIGTLQLQDCDALPVELVECFATCFWAIQACRTAADSKQGMDGLRRQLAELSVRIYQRSGLTRTECEDHTVTAIFHKMTSTFALGASLEEILALHRESVARCKPVGKPLPT